MDKITQDYRSRMQLNSPLLGRLVEGIERVGTRDLEQLIGFATLVLFDRAQPTLERKEG